MSNYARIIDGIAVDVSPNPAEHFHPDIAGHFVEVPTAVTVGCVQRDNGSWGRPPTVEAPVPELPRREVVGPNEFYFLWTIQEQVAIDGLRETDVVIKLFLRRLDDPKTTEVVLASAAVRGAVTHTVQALVANGTIKETDAEARIVQILAGKEPA